jgi:DNA-binding transcriptional MerR regulator/methylmalonyl-CoA mutase cobalamin-binding subunit
MISIGVAARQSGLEICTLRKWEERYGFPKPVRLKSGQRRYLDREIEQLLVVVRRVAAGERPGQVIRELQDIFVANHALAGHEPPACDLVKNALAALLKHDVPALRSALEEALSARCMAAFIEEIAGPMTRLVGEYWARGELPIYGEHLYSAVLDSLLVREVSLSKAAGVQPTVLLTTAAGEQHTLGLSMVNAVLAAAGVASLRLQGGLPVTEITAAATAYGVQVVGVSATCLYPPKILSGFMCSLRNALPGNVALWFGGTGVDKLAQIPSGVTVFASMYELRDACESLDLSGAQALQNKKVA